jgi:eukaryotic-like serine/threonine-protein kinase
MHAVGHRISNGRYEVLQAFPPSGEGEAYLVHDHYEDQDVVLKLLDSSKLSGNWQWDEARILRRLSGDFILPVLNADLAEGGVPFIVTEYATNGSLEAATPTTGLPQPAAIRYVREACRGVTRTLDQGLLHRDVKPGNIFIDERGRARLGDFGFAHVRDAAGNAPPEGSYTTVAPEVASSGDCTPRSEVYSLGATLYYALGGRFPHDHRRYSSKRAYRDAILNTASDRIADVAPHISAGLARVIDRCLVRDPTDRYQHPQELDETLGQLRGGAFSWLRTDHHGSHEKCWRGEHPSRETLDVCLIPIPGQRSVKYDIEVRRSGSGVRLKLACRTSVPSRDVPRQVRSAMRQAAK